MYNVTNPFYRRIRTAGSKDDTAPMPYAKTKVKQQSFSEDTLVDPTRELSTAGNPGAAGEPNELTTALLNIARTSEIGSMSAVEILKLLSKLEASFHNVPQMSSAELHRNIKNFIEVEKMMNAPSGVLLRNPTID